MHPKHIAKTSKTHPKGPKHNQNAVDRSHVLKQKVSRDTDIFATSTSVVAERRGYDRILPAVTDTHAIRDNCLKCAG
jgi:hypothetical protein